ncbi:MAG TPA: DUF2066 domain-containing protein [Steroidobacteraceae bacterium]|nr:DUF2066 domain-containing protein [Steroidobacteraceae bacterium]
MTSKRTNVGPPEPTRLLARGLLAACWLCAGAAIPAHADVPLYQAIVPLAGSTEADRTQAVGEALKVAAVRASGRTAAATSPRIVAAASQPASYVQQYSTTSDRQLRVGFDGRAVEQLLTQAGLPLWPAERPPVTVYLFAPSVAGGARAITAGERTPERDEVERVAQRRGVPVAWPTELVDPASARARIASPGAVLLGQGAGVAFEWTFAHAGQSARAQGPLDAGVDLAADRLAERYAPASTRSTASVTLRIGGLDGVRDYAALLEYLEGLSLVRGVEVREFVRDSVEVALVVRGDRELLERIFALERRLVPAAGGAGGVEFVWQRS